MSMTFKRIAAGAALLAASALSHGVPVTLESGFGFYSGPLGRLYEVPDYAIDTYFTVNGGAPVLQAPTTPYASGTAAGDPRAGTGTANVIGGFRTAPSTVEFYFGLFGDSTGLGFLRNSYTLATSPANVNVGDVFKLATLTIQNGSWHVGDGTQNIPAQMSFAIRATSAVLGTHVWVDTLVHTNRSVTGGSVADNADLYSFMNFAHLGTLAVNDGGTGSIDITGRIGSLIPVAFANPTGDLFIVGSQTPVALPGTLLLSLLGLGGLARVRRRSGALT